MCSNREKSLVINNGSISIIIFVHTKKNKRQQLKKKTKCYPYCTLIAIVPISILHCTLHLWVFCAVIVSSCSLFSAVFLSFIYETHIKSRRCHSDLLFLLKTELYTINTNFLSHLEIVMFLCALLSVGVSVYAEYHPLCVR